MKKIFLIIGAIGAAALLNAQEIKTVQVWQNGSVLYEREISQVDSITVKTYNVNSTAESVIINGVTWATRNVDAPNTFAADITDSGKFYQWNSTAAWATAGSVEGWDNAWNGGYAAPTGNDTWQTANNVCPTGYRLPTSAEQQSLLNSGSVWTTINGVKGRVFGSGNNSLFLPAAGFRYNSDGTLFIVGSNGTYWSSEADSADYARCLYFDSGYADWYGDSRAHGFSVRCVAE